MGGPVLLIAVHLLQGKQGRLRGRTFSAPRKWARGKGRITCQFGCCYNYAVDGEGRKPGKCMLHRFITKHACLPVHVQPWALSLHVARTGKQQQCMLKVLFLQVTALIACVYPGCGRRVHTLSLQA